MDLMTRIFRLQTTSKVHTAQHSAHSSIERKLSQHHVTPLSTACTQHLHSGGHDSAGCGISDTHRGSRGFPYGIRIPPPQVLGQVVLVGIVSCVFHSVPVHLITSLPLSLAADTLPLCLDPLDHRCSRELLKTRNR